MRAALAWLALFCLVAVARAESPKERAHALFKEGEAAYSGGHYDEAIKKYSEAFALVPLPLLLFDLGQAYRMKGERDKAIDNYRKYLDVDPNGRVAGEAREHLDELLAQIQKEQVAKRAADEAKKRAVEEARVRAAAEAKRAAAEAEKTRVEAEKRKQADAVAAAQQKRAADEEAARHAELKAEAKRQRAAEDAKKPVWKKPWFWATMGAAVVIVGVAAGVGAAYGSRDKDPNASWGSVPAN